jgi:hypothetical protein
VRARLVTEFPSSLQTNGERREHTQNRASVWFRFISSNLAEFLSPPDQTHDYKEIGKKRTPEFRTRRYRVEPRTRWYRAEFRSVG